MPPITERDGDLDADDQDIRQRQTEPETVEVTPEPEAPHEPEVDVIEASDDDGQDERISGADEREHDDDRQQRRKETAAERRERQRQAKLRDKREIEFQRAELARLERTVQELSQGQVVTRVTELDNRISSAESEVKQWESVKAAAINARNGADVVASEKFLSDAQLKRDQARWDRENLIRQANAPKAPQLPSYAGYAKAFFDANPWYDHSGGDEDSLIVKALDAAVAREYNPNSAEYWNELQRRVNKRLGKQPTTRRDSREEDYDVEDEPEPRQQTRRGPPTGGSTRGNSSAGGRQQIRLSPERVQALKDANLWDDPKSRERMAKQYAEYDRLNRNTRTG
jgi:hypothetical protein